jgi:hypothetical protein
MMARSRSAFTLIELRVVIAGARVIVPRTLSPRRLARQAVKGPRGKDVHADRYAITTRWTSSAAQPQDRVTSALLSTSRETMTIDNSVD